MPEVAEKTKMKNPVEDRGFYELYMLLSSTEADKNISEVENKIQDILTNNKAEVVRKDRFVKKSLAYSIKQSNNAYAGSIYFYCEPQNIEEIQTNLKESGIDFLRVLIGKTSSKPAKTTTRVKESDLDKIHEKLTHRTKEKVGTATEPKHISTEKPKEDAEKMSLEDIDKKLDEIMGSL